MSERYVVICEVREEGRTYILAVPLERVQGVRSRRTDPDIPVSPWPGISTNGALSPFALLIKGADDAKPVWNVLSPRKVSKEAIHPVPVLLQVWAQRVNVEEFFWHPPHLIPIVLL